MQTIKLITSIKAVINTALMFFLLTCISCKSSQISSNSIKGIKLFVNYPVSIINGDNNSFFILIDTVSIFYLDNYILYRLPESRNFETNEKILGTESYFLFEEKATKGFFFTTIKDSSKYLKLPVDSVLKARAYFGANFYISPDDSLVEISTIDKNTYLEKYVKKTSTGFPPELTPDSIYYYFTNTMKDINYSISPKLDGVKKMKTYMVRIMFNQKFSEQHKLMINKREILYGIQKIVFKNPNEIINMIEQFKKSVSIMKSKALTFRHNKLFLNEGLSDFQIDTNTILKKPFNV